MTQSVACNIFCNSQDLKNSAQHCAQFNWIAQYHAGSSANYRRITILLSACSHSGINLADSIFLCGRTLMRIAIPYYQGRVAPSFLYANATLLAHVVEREIISQQIVSSEEFTEDERIAQLEECRVQVLICGGIARPLMEELRDRGIEVINNAIGKAEDVLAQYLPDNQQADNGIGLRHEEKQTAARIDCIACQDRICLEGLPCPVCPDDAVASQLSGYLRQSLDVATDICAEPERVLCRVAELVYYCQGMGHTRLGIAFCVDLFHEAEVLASVLRRFFNVTATCCQVGTAPKSAIEPEEENGSKCCHVVSMVKILNHAKTDINVTVGLSMGADVCFNQLSLAPTTTLFVKDKLLANNPIGAIYSKYQQDNVLSKI
jgi:uncharacterized metal-binding protein/predicted Fe-Mo cluster-binding NifX family protein